MSTPMGGSLRAIGALPASRRMRVTSLTKGRNRRWACGELDGFRRRVKPAAPKLLEDPFVYPPDASVLPMPGRIGLRRRQEVVVASRKEAGLDEHTGNPAGTAAPHAQYDDANLRCWCLRPRSPLLVAMAD
jgi:hypothetical protein